MRWRRFCITEVAVVLAEVALSGTVDNPFFPVYAAFISLAGTMTIGPRPRQPGRWWGTIDQKIALEAQEDTRQLKRMLRGLPPEVPLAPFRFDQLMSMARSEWLTRLWFSYGEMLLAALLSVMLIGEVIQAKARAVQMAAQVILAPALMWLGRREWSLSRHRLRALRAMDSTGPKQHHPTR